MSKHTCGNCGLNFQSDAELKNHKLKYCLNSDYGDVAKLDQRLADLRHAPADDRAGLREIRDFLGGAGDGPAALNQGAAGYGSLPPSQAWRDASRDAGAGAGGGTLLEQAERLKEDRSRQRELLDGHDQDTLSILRDLGQRKERELKAQIEKEEIARAIKQVDRNELDVLAGQKKRELGQLANEREAVRVKEAGLMEAISKMEGQLLDQEQYFRREKAMADSTDPARRGEALKGLRDKEVAWAEGRAAQVAKVKQERDRLEQDRSRIMQELEQVQTKGFHMNTPTPSFKGEKLGAGYRAGSRLGSGFRGSQAALRVGSSVALEKPPSGFGMRHALEPSMKDNLVADQVRINQMRAQQAAHHQNQQLMGVDEIDVLQRELDQRPTYAEGVAGLRQEYAHNPDGVDRAGYLDALRGKLEHEAAGPSSHPRPPPGRPPAPQKGYQAHPQWSAQPNLSKPPPATEGLMTKLDDLEGLLLRDAPGAPHRQPQDQLPGSYRQQVARNPLQAGAPPSVGPGAGYGFQQPPPQQYPGPQQQQLPWAGPGGPGGFGGQPQNAHNFRLPPQAPQNDPAMAQLAQMVSNQDDENRKLREVLENFGKNANSQEELTGVIKGAQSVLQRLGAPQAVQQQALTAGNGGPVPTPQAALPSAHAYADLPDEFAFRQNEARCQDLEVEERALMNLAAQEYDALRVIEKLPKESEIYNYKLKQYKELSAMRAEVEKVLQEQRLEKIKRDFERQKVDEERGQRHADWLEHQKRAILEGRIGGAPMAIQQEPYREPPSPATASSGRRQRPEPLRPPVQQYQPEQPVFQQQQQPVQAAPRRDTRSFQPSPAIIPKPRAVKREGYDPEEGFLVQVDAVFGAPRQVRRLRVVHMALESSGPEGEPNLAGPGDSEPDTINPDLNKVILGSVSTVTDIEPRPDARLLLEMQAVDPVQKSGFTGFGWTWLDLFTNDGQLNSGAWCLPAYAGAPALDQVAVSGARDLTPTPRVTLCIRIGLPPEQALWRRPDHTTSPTEYIVPEVHKGIARPAEGQQQPSALSAKSPSIVQSPARPLADQQQGPRRNPNYRCDGLRFVLHYATTQHRHDALDLKIQIQSIDGDVLLQNSGDPCEAEAPGLPAPATQHDGRQGGRVVVSPGSVKLVTAEEQSQGQLARLSKGSQGISPPLVQSGVVRPLEDMECGWERDLYNLFWDQQRSKPLFMVCQLFARPPGGQPQPIGYMAFEILDRETGELKYGFHEAPLNQPPVVLQERGRRVIRGEALGFSLVDLDDERPRTGAMSEQFMENMQKQFTLGAGWTDVDALDIYVDAARLLPDNVTITRLTVRVVDSDLRDVQPPQSILANVDRSTLRNQFYGMKFELRPQQKLKPTSLVYMTLETVDKSSNQARFAGFSYFPLFMDAEEGLPPVTDVDAKLAPLLGGYQMPLFAGKVNEATPFTYEKFVFLERAPTASLLVRVMKSSKHNAAPQEVPEYKDGVYGTAYFNVTDEEVRIMKLRRRRPNPDLHAVVAELLRANGAQGNAQGDADLMYLDQLVRCDYRKSEMLDQNYHSQYEPSLGVRVNVEAIHNNETKGFLAVMCSVLPSPHYYDESNPDRGKNVFTFVEPDYDSHHITAKFQEGDACVLGYEPAKAGLSLLFDVRIYMPATGQYADYGFALCPMLDLLDTDANKGTSEWYVHSGVFSLPVYRGAPSRATVDAIAASGEPMETLRQLRRAGGIVALGTTSIIVRVVDTPRKFHFHKTIDQQPPSLRYLDPDQKSYTYAPALGGVFATPVKLGELVPAAWARDRAGFAAQLEQQFNQFMGLPGQ